MNSTVGDNGSAFSLRSKAFRIRTRQPGNGPGVTLDGEGWRQRLGEAPPAAADTDPREVLRICIQYLTNNRQRMKHPEYRRQGPAATSAWMGPLVKELNWRVKGTGPPFGGCPFWNNPEGAEAILQVRAAAGCDDEGLKAHLQTRPGCPVTRRPKPAKLTKAKKNS